MAINKSMRRVLKALSFDGIEVEASRHLANLKAIDPMKIFHKTIDYKIYNGNHQIPVRIFLPGEKMEDDLPVFLFFHGGGWVTESIDNYERKSIPLSYFLENGYEIKDKYTPRVDYLEVLDKLYF